MRYCGWCRVGTFGPARLAALTAAALAGFAANQLLTRIALSRALIDPASFAIIRVASGAIALALLVGPRAGAAAGSWPAALALAAYAIAFTLAYVRVGASAGAMLHFASVQVVMIGWGLVQKERPTRQGAAGFALAFTGFLALVAPGVTAPDTIGAVLMSIAGVAWGIYSLLGRSAGEPIVSTAGNFIRALPLVAVGLLPALPRHAPSGTGLLLAIFSGAVASGLAYAAWYAAVARLAAWRAAIVQLIVPVLTAALAVPLLGETVTWRLVIAGSAVAAGVLLAVAARMPKDR